MIQALAFTLYVLLIPMFWGLFAVLLARLPNGPEQPPAVRKRVSWTHRRGIDDEPPMHFRE